MYLIPFVLGYFGEMWYVSNMFFGKKWFLPPFLAQKRGFGSKSGQLTKEILKKFCQKSGSKMEQSIFEGSHFGGL